MRVEFWGDEIDNISYFDPETQRRTTETCDSFIITPSTEILINDKEKAYRSNYQKSHFTSWQNFRNSKGKAFKRM